MSGALKILKTIGDKELKTEGQWKTKAARFFVMVEYLIRIKFWCC